MVERASQGTITSLATYSGGSPCPGNVKQNILNLVVESQFLKKINVNYLWLKT
jgi:hypothetical protein